MSLVSKELVDFVKSFEGFSATKYDDGTGTITLGYGMTGEEIQGLDTVTEQQASNMLEDLLNNKYAIPLKADLDSKDITLNQSQFDALVSMSYNVGVGAVLGSTLYRNIVAGIRDKDTITADFQMWSMAGGQRLEGLYRRRTAEAEMFFSNDNVLIVKEEDDMKLEKVVLYQGDGDVFAAIIVAQKYQCGLFKKSDFENSGLKADNIIPIGGIEPDRYATFKAAANLL